MGYWHIILLVFAVLMLNAQMFYYYACMVLLKCSKVPSIHTQQQTQKFSETRMYLLLFSEPSIMEYQAIKMAAAHAELLTRMNVGID